MAKLPIFLPGEFPWTEEPGGLQSMGSVLRMFRTIMSILCNESTYLSNKPECQQKGLN